MSKMFTANLVLHALMDDLQKRKGFDALLESLDEDTMKEMKDTWRLLIMDVLENA